MFNYWITYLRFISAAYFSFEASCINEFSATYLACSQPGQELGAGELNFMFKARGAGGGAGVFGRRG